jgi:serine/threonine protein kinase
VKLMDFGIARDENMEQVTRTGALVGTPMYLAPEIVKGKSATEESDIYALGALLYFAVSGRKLFAHATNENLFPLIAAGKFPSLSKVTKGLPRHLRNTIERCLETKPEKRFRSASELKRELEIILAEERVWVNHAERLVAYLSAHDFLSRKEAQTWVDMELEWLISKDPVQTEGPPSRKWLFGAAAVGLVSLGTVAAYAFRLDEARWRSAFEALMGR